MKFESVNICKILDWKFLRFKVLVQFFKFISKMSDIFLKGKKETFGTHSFSVFLQIFMYKFMYIAPSFVKPLLMDYLFIYVLI